MNMVDGIALLLLGLAFGLFGYGAFRLVVLTVGLILGLWAGLEAATVFVAPWAAIALPLVGALLGALALGSSVALALFAFGAFTGMTLLAYAASLAGLAVFSTHPALWTAAAVGGIAALILRRPIIVIGTAVVGAALVVRALFALWSGQEALALNVARDRWAAFAVDPGVLSSGGEWLCAISAALLVVVFCVAQGAAYRRLPATSISGAHYEKKGT